MAQYLSNTSFFDFEIPVDIPKDLERLDGPYKIKMHMFAENMSIEYKEICWEWTVRLKFQD